MTSSAVTELDVSAILSSSKVSLTGGSYPFTHEVCGVLPTRPGGIMPSGETTMPTLTIRPPSRETAFLLTAFINRPNGAPDFEAICRSGRVHVIAPEGAEDADITEILRAFADETNDQFSTPDQLAAAREVANKLSKFMTWE